MEQFFVSLCPIIEESFLYQIYHIPLTIDIPIAYTIQKMIEYFSPDAKRINHALKVYGFAKCITGIENVSPFAPTAKIIMPELYLEKQQNLDGERMIYSQPTLPSLGLTTP